MSVSEMSIVVCKYHPTVEAVENCYKCHAAICLNDLRRFGVFPYCPNCYKKVKSKNTISWIVVFAMFGGLLLIGVLLIAFKPQL